MLLAGCFEQRCEWRGRLTSFALEHDPGVVAGIARAAGARNGIEQAFAAGACREAGWRADFAEHADRGGALIDEGNHRLRFERAVLQRG